MVHSLVLLLAADLWQVVVIPTQADFRGLAAVDAKRCWVSGTGGTVARTIDGGQTWTIKTLPGCEKLDFRDIEARDAKTAYAMAAGPGDTSQIWKTADGGDSWTKQFVNPEKDGFLDAIAFWDETHGLALGDPIRGRFQLLQTTDGQTWNAIQGPEALPDEGCFAASGTCLVTFGKNDAWFCTGGAKVSRLHRTNDRGKTWSVVDLPIRAGAPSRGAFGIHVIDDKQAVVVGGDYKSPEDTTATVALTSDAGRTWFLAANPLPFRSAATSHKSAWLAVGPTGTNLVDQTSRQGSTSADTTPLNCVQTTTDGTIWAAGPKGTVRRIHR